MGGRTRDAVRVAIIVALVLSAPAKKYAREQHHLGKGGGESLLGESAFNPLKSPYVCFSAHPDYNASACEAGALGMTLDSLRHDIVVSPTSLFDRTQDKSTHAGCEKHVKVFRINEIETRFPSLAQCWLSTYAGQLQQGAQNADCQVESIDQADTIYMPAYLGQECNWPHYGGGACFGENQFRQGKICRDEAVHVADLLQKAHGKPVIINDMLPTGGINGEEATGIWAKLNALAPHNHVISQAPPPVWPRCSACSTNKVTECYGAPLQDKKYIMSFKGNFATNPIRGAIATLYQNEEGVVIVNSDSLYDYDDLMFNSKFSLILAGDQAFSYRFTESVCSGGVPVLVTTSWVPPFDRSIPFTSYGIKVNEADARSPGHLLAVLNNYTMTDLEGMRSNARSVCENSLSTVAKQAKQMVSEALSMV